MLLSILESLENIRFFDIKLMDVEDFLTLLVRYLIDLIIAWIVIQLIYRKTSGSKEFLFTFYLMNSLVFLVCYIFDSAKVSIGFAFGLFAIFGILRYRTTTIPSKEMTYLFTLIGIAVINALATRKISYAELLFANGIVIGVTALLEFYVLKSQEEMQDVVYEKIDLIKPEKEEELLNDLSLRLGKKVVRVEIGQVDFMRDIARMRVFYVDEKKVFKEEIHIPDKIRTIALIAGLGLGMVSCDYVTVESKYDKLSDTGYVDEDDAPDIFDDEVLHEVRLFFNQEKVIDTLTALKEFREEEHITKYLGGRALVDGVYYDSVGVRFKGESSYDFSNTPKKSLKLDFDYFDFGQKHQGQRKLNLLNGFKDPTMIREKMYLDLLHEYGLPAPKSSYTKVYINDEYWGLYLITQQIDKHFLSDHFRTRKGNLYKGQPDPDLKWLGPDSKPYRQFYLMKHRGGKEYYEDLIYLILSLSDPFGRYTERPNEYASRVRDLMNFEDLAMAWAINNFYLNIDAYNMYFAHNFYLYHHPYTRKWEWISYDGNYSFGAWTPGFTLNDCIDLPVVWNDQKYEKPFTTLVYQNEGLRSVYLDAMFMVSSQFDLDAFSNEVNVYAKLIREAMYDDPHKFYTNDEFDRNINQHLGDVTDPGAYIPGLIPFMRDRSRSVQFQMRDFGYSYKKAS